jgi:hypothetical protein
MGSVESSIPTDSGGIRCASGAERQVWRVGYAPEPWSWTPWQFAEDGRFNGRWDDPNGVWRSLYVGDSPLACYLEVLARFRFDPSLQSELAQIEEDDVDARDHATVSGGVLPRSWLQPRLVGRALLTGWYAVPGDKESLPTLRARFLPLATRMHLSDVDAAAIRLAERAPSRSRSQRGSSIRADRMTVRWQASDSSHATVMTRDCGPCSSDPRMATSPDAWATASPQRSTMAIPNSSAMRIHRLSWDS